MQAWIASAHSYKGFECIGCIVCLRIKQSLELIKQLETALIGVYYSYKNMK